MKKVFLIRTFFISLAAMLLLGTFSVLLLHYHAEKLVKDDLMRLSDIIKDEAQRENVNFKNLATYSDSVGKAFRVTFIDSTGDVFADSANIATEENHSERPEVKSALSGAPAFDKRFSQTLGKKMTYYAVPFIRKSDGSICVLRVALETSTVTDVILSSLPVFAAIIIVLSGALLLVNGKYNSALRLPFREIKERLHTINSGDFQKIPLQSADDELLPVINEINDIAENMASLMGVRSEFFANASHELNTPLTYISGYAEMMETGLLTDAEKIRECGGNIRSQAARMDALVKDMLKLSYLENNERQLLTEEFSVKEMIDGILESFSALIKANNIRVETYCFADAVHSDKTLMHNILVNLIQNALRYNVENGSVEIIVKQTKNALEISVSDTGIGIKEVDQPRIFERFYRVDKSRSKNSGGTGLGLAIVKHSAARLSGVVSVESRPGKGSKFTVTFPEKN